MTAAFTMLPQTPGRFITPFDGQDEASWVKLQDGSILTIDPFGTNTERFVPSLNKWVVDTPVPTAMYGWGGELARVCCCPTARRFFRRHRKQAVYTPWTSNYAGIFTPEGATNAGTWTWHPSPTITPRLMPAAMMVNGTILCCMANTNNGFGSSAYFYEYNYVSNAFTQISSPTGGSSFNTVAYGCTMLDLPDGTVLMSSGSSLLFNYKPSGTSLTNGIPAILSATTNWDGSFLDRHLVQRDFGRCSLRRRLANEQRLSIARLTNSSGNILYCRTYNWSTCNLMTGTNVVTTEMTLPPGMLAGTYPLFVTANGISSAPYSLHHRWHATAGGNWFGIHRDRFQPDGVSLERHWSDRNRLCGRNAPPTA